MHLTIYVRRYILGILDQLNSLKVLALIYKRIVHLSHPLWALLVMKLLTESLLGQCVQVTLFIVFYRPPHSYQDK